MKGHRKFCIDVFSGFTYDELLPMIKKIGFDGFFSGEIYAEYSSEIDHIRQLADHLHLYYETSHATIPGSTSIWTEEMDGESYSRLLLKCIDYCAVFHIPILVVHVGLDPSVRSVFETGMNRLKPVIKHAKQKEVKIAFENINSEAYLLQTLHYFQEEHVGFCYDCGHEFCHTPGTHYLPAVKNRLFCTHLHDNDGTCDQHLIPFDGRIDFEKVCQELLSIEYCGNLTLELTYYPYQDSMTKQEFLQKSYFALKRIEKMLKK